MEASGLDFYKALLFNVTALQEAAPTATSAAPEEGIDVVVKDSTVVSAGFSPEVLFINIGARARALAKFWRPKGAASVGGMVLGQAPLVKPLDPGQSDRWPGHEPEGEPAKPRKRNWAWDTHRSHRNVSNGCNDLDDPSTLQIGCTELGKRGAIWMLVDSKTH